MDIILTKEYVKELKVEYASGISNLIKNYKDSGSISFILENLGRLPKNFDAGFLPDLLFHKNANVRLLAVKTIGKLSDEKFLDILIDFLHNEKDTSVRRETVSSIGRLRSPKIKTILFKMLNDNDPKIVCQAIRGLLVFKSDSDVNKNLMRLSDHENEMVKSIINKEFSSSKNIISAQKHSDSYDYLKNVVVNSDTLDAMKLMNDESIHLTFTSPPYYNARDYSIYPSYKNFLEFLAKVFKEVFRITKEGRFLVLNTSPIIIPRISRSHSSKRYPIPFDVHPYLIDMGWEFIDDIVWLKPESTVKNRIGGFMQHRKPLAYKPNSVTEYLMVYRKSTEKLLDWNIKQYDWKTISESKVGDGYENNNVWKIDPCSNKNHTAVFPAELCKRVIQYYSYKRDLIFDPFAGSGTVGRTAKTLDRYFLLTEKDIKYFEYMKSSKANELFEHFPTRFLNLEEFNQTINNYATEY